ncbi:DNA cross-link repair protein SNM1 [Acorus gramineus]|uniref:5' exonuclease Apollo n=1 Tax=Acorus gramineus TaxID=55184 RepID=A0AAV9A9U7_ACOGR|nr:DNA cross-link repair protein SNM1 [Acorus gramineus]
MKSLSSDQSVQYRVTPIDACHCPGAVMFLFNGDFGKVLYTGDFRWEIKGNRAQMAKYMLLRTLGKDKVDFLHVDNTFCHPSFSFPPREVAAQQVVDIISSYPKHDILIGIDTLGKEDLLVHISHALNTKIWVWPERLQTMHLLGFDDVFTTKTCLTRVRAVPRYSLTIDTIEALNTVKPTIGIMPSGLPWSVTMFNSNKHSRDPSFAVRLHLDKNQLNSPQRFHRYVYSVPYSEHSCFNEIGEFIQLVQPFDMSGIVTSSFCYINPRHHFGHLCGAYQLLGRSWDNLEDHELFEKTEFMQIGSVSRFRDPKMGGNNRMAPKNYCSGIRRSRVSLVRREKRGVKIIEDDSFCASDLNTGIT